MADEYSKYYKRVHKSDLVLREILKNPLNNILDGELTNFPLVMDDIFKENDVVKSYKNLYIYKQKVFLMEWKNGRIKPSFLENT